MWADLQSCAFVFVCGLSLAGCGADTGAGSPDGLERGAVFADSGARDAATRDAALGGLDSGQPLPDTGVAADSGSTPDASNGDVDAGTDSGMPGNGPAECLPLFEEACTPTIDFSNAEPNDRGAIFTQVIPDPVAFMQDVACTVCSILYRDPSEIPAGRQHTQISLILEDFDGVAFAGGDEIHVSLRHIDNYDNQSADEQLTEFHGVLVHETVHLYQENADPKGGLIEGVADFVRVRAGLYEPGRRNLGGNWYDAYTTSGFFLSWLAGPCAYHDDGRVPNDPDIGWAVNQQIGTGWTEQIWIDRFGTDVETLWQEYQDAIQ